MAQGEAEHDQAEVVLLAGRAGQHRAGTAAAVPAPGQREQAAPDHVAREMLLRDGGLAALPAVAQLAQVRQDHVARNGVEAERPDRAVEGGLRPGVVEAIERCAQLGGEAGEGGT